MGKGRERRPFSGAVREVWRLLKQGIDMPTDWQPALHSELRSLAEPHMAVLTHKRARMQQDEKWIGELTDFVGRTIWPHLKDSENLMGRSAACVAELLDEIV